MKQKSHWTAIKGPWFSVTPNQAEFELVPFCREDWWHIHNPLLQPSFPLLMTQFLSCWTHQGPHHSISSNPGKLDGALLGPHQRHIPVDHFVLPWPPTGAGQAVFTDFQVPLIWECWPRINMSTSLLWLFRAFYKLPHKASLAWEYHVWNVK